MIFISLGRFRRKPTKEMTAGASNIIEQMAKEGVKVLGFYWTLGRYDTVVIMDAKDEKAAMRMGIKVGDLVSTETLVAVTREEAHELLD